MEALEVHQDSAARLKQRLTVSYAEYRELEKSWQAARNLVSLHGASTAEYVSTSAPGRGTTQGIIVQWCW